MSSVEQAQTMAFEAIDKPEGGRHMGGSTLLSARLLMWTSFQKVAANKSSAEIKQDSMASVLITACLDSCCSATHTYVVRGGACTIC